MTDFPISQQLYEQKVRVRACGLLEQDGKLLLIKHKNIGSKGYIWLPPGGGVPFGMSAEETVIREMKEEAGLDVSVDQFLFINEFRNSKYHALELFFKVSISGGVPQLGTDPEVPGNEQILTELAFVPFYDIDQLEPEAIHNCFQYSKASENIFDLRGFFTFHNI